MLRALTRQLGTRATLALFLDADHSFHVPARSGRKDADVRAEMLDALAGWIEKVVSRSPQRAAGARPRLA